MSDHQYLCVKHRTWVNAHPKEAFNTLLQMTTVAEILLQQTDYQQAIPLLGSAFETAEIIFDQGIESPQLTTSFTSLGIMLAHAYASAYRFDMASGLLQKLQNKMQMSMQEAGDYETKSAFFRHCCSAIAEAELEILACSESPVNGRFQPFQPFQQLH
jgi:hypothetical protein